MNTRTVFLASAFALALIAPVPTYAQGVLGGAQDGADQGSQNGGAVGAVVGGTVGAVTGGINGLIGIKQKPRFRQYVIEQHTPSFQYEDPVAVGIVLPDEGVEYYDVPVDYGEVRYRYTVVNDQVVLVDPATRQIVEIVR